MSISDLMEAVCGLGLLVVCGLLMIGAADILIRESWRKR